MSNSAFPNAQNQPAGAIPVYLAGSAAILPFAIFGNQQAATGASVALAAQPLVNGIVIKLISGAGPVYVGPPGVAAGTGYPLLSVGDAISYSVANTSDVAIIGTGTIAWTGN